MATGYTAGNLSLVIEGVSDKAVQSLDNVINRLSSLSSILKTVTKDDLKWLTSLGTRLQTLGKKMNEIDWSQVSNGFQQLTTSIEPFLNKITEAKDSLTALYGILQKTSTKGFGNMITSITNGGNGGKRQSVATEAFGNINFFGVVGKIRFAVSWARRLGSALADVVQAGVDYTETLNLWQVAMRENLSQATEFVGKMNKAFGVSEKTLMNMQAIFKNMVGTLGQISDTVAYNVSEAVTKMAIDYSSLYNITVEEASEKFQSMLAGLVRPIRTVSGYDITETTLFELYQQLGGVKSMRQLTRTEKQLLSILAIFRQMGRSGALGDMEKTLSNFANQSRMLTENWKQVKTYAGLTLKMWLENANVLVNLNALLIVLADVLKGLAYAAGYVEPDFTNIFEDVQDINKELEKTQGYLLGFDKFRALDEGVAGEEDIALDDIIIDAVANYQSIITESANVAGELAKQWEKVLGLTDENKDGVLDYNDSLKAIKGILTGIAVAGAVIAGTLGVQAILAIVGALSKLFNVLIGISVPLTTIVGLVSALIVFGIGIKQFINAWSDMSPIERAIGIISALVAAVLALATGIKFFHSIVTGITFAVAAAGAVLALVSSINQALKPKGYAEGGLPDRGTLFYAGEAGAEVVYNTNSNGQTGVANVAQLKSAFLQALVEYGNRNQGNIVVNVEYDGDTLFKATRKVARRNGYDYSKV